VRRFVVRFLLRYRSSHVSIACSTAGDLPRAACLLRHGFVAHWAEDTCLRELARPVVIIIE